MEEILINKIIAKTLGLEAAVLLGELLNLFNNNKQEEFSCSLSVLSENTTLSKRSTINAIKKLKEAQILGVTAKGMPRRNYYKINLLVLSELTNTTSSAKTEQLITTGDTTTIEVIKESSSSIKYDTTWGYKYETACIADCDTASSVDYLILDSNGDTEVAPWDKKTAQNGVLDPKQYQNKPKAVPKQAHLSSQVGNTSSSELPPQKRKEKKESCKERKEKKQNKELASGFSEENPDAGAFQKIKLFFFSEFEKETGYKMLWTNRIGADIKRLLKSLSENEIIRRMKNYFHTEDRYIKNNLSWANFISNIDKPFIVQMSSDSNLLSLKQELDIALKENKFWLIEPLKEKIKKAEAI